MRVLIIGFGNMGQNHYERYKKLGIEVAAVIDNDPVKKEIAATHRLPCYFTLTAYLREYKKKTIDLIDICLPTDLHFPYMKRVMETFINDPIPIVVEKPIVRTSAEADSLEKLASKYLALIFVAEVEHYNERINAFLQSLEDPVQLNIVRSVNKHYFLRGTNQWSLNEKRSGGMILDLMIHDLSILDRKFGEASLLKGEFKRKKFDIIDEATVDLAMGDIKAHVTGSWLSQDPEHPIILTMEATERSGAIKKLRIDDYTIRGSNYNEHDAFYLELQSFIKSIKEYDYIDHLEEYLRVVKLANQIIELAAKKNLCPARLYQSVAKKENTLNEGQAKRKFQALQ